MTLEQLYENKKTIGIVCNQWGDSGKGKFIDLLAALWADIIIRCTGGANAGHTLKNDFFEMIFHLIPSGILLDSEGKENIIGRGVAFDPRIVKEELTMLEDSNFSYNHLKIAYDAHLVLPSHLVMDRVKENSDGTVKIGTTGRGIGPLYRDHVDRIGLKVYDMLDKDSFVKKLRNNLGEKVKLLKNTDSDLVKKVMQHEHLLDGDFYSKKDIFDVDAIVEVYIEHGKFFRQMLIDAEKYVQSKVGKSNILLEGAQGALLDIDYGTYPFLTSSNPTVTGLAKGACLSEKQIDIVYGILKAFYMTRVGEGPFPTEIGGKDSEEWCSTHNKDNERSAYPDADINSSDEFEQGVAIRYAGGEYGATTKRARRCGWFDLPAAKKTTQHHINGLDVILTKLDVLDECKTIKVCVSYDYQGPEKDLGFKVLKPGTTMDMAYTPSEIMEHCVPVYKEFPGWQTDTTGLRDYRDAPKELQDLIEFVEREGNFKVHAGSVGPKREETFIKVVK